MSAAMFTIPGMAKNATPESDKKVTISAKVGSKLYDRIAAMAEEDRRTVSWMVEDLLRRYFEQADKRKR